MQDSLCFTRTYCTLIYSYLSLTLSFKLLCSIVLDRNTESFVELTVRSLFEVEKLKVGVFLQRSFFT